MKFQTACARLIAGVLALLFIITLVVSLFLFNAQGQFGKADLYKQVLIKERVYDSLPRFLSLQIAKSMTYNPCEEDPSTCENQDEEASEDDEGGPPDYFKNLDAAQWELLLREILTHEWVQTQTESIIDQFFEFLDSEETVPSIRISLVEVKLQLTGRRGVETVMILLEGQPACTEEQLREIKDSFATDDLEMDLLSCQPPQEILNTYLTTIEENLQEFVGELPDEAIIGENFMEEGSGKRSDDEDGNLQIGTLMRRVRTNMRLSPIVPVVLLLLIAVFGVRSFRDLLRWWGIPLFISGLVALIISVLSMPIFNWLLRTYVEGQIPGYLSQEFVDFGFEIGRSAMRSFVKTVTIQAGGIALVGLVMTTLSAFIRPRRADLLE